VAELIELRRSERVSIETLAERSGYGPATLRNWEHGRRQPGLFAFADVLEVMGARLSITHNEKKLGVWIKTAEAAKIMGITQAAVQAAIQRGALVARRAGRHWQVDRRSAQAYIAGNHQSVAVHNARQAVFSAATALADAVGTATLGKAVDRLYRAVSAMRQLDDGRDECPDSF
jgi:transcriptional regulator with XRE-family HTH domain